MMVNDSPRVFVPPPLIFLAGLIVGHIADAWLGWRNPLGETARYAVGTKAFVVACGMLVGALQLF